MLGVLARAGVVWDERIMLDAIDRHFAEKGRSDPKNRIAFRTGCGNADT
jgi:hypothetical protein